jgi:hypothetical protein
MKGLHTFIELAAALEELDQHRAVTKARTRWLKRETRKLKKQKKELTT